MKGGEGGRFIPTYTPRPDQICEDVRVARFRRGDIGKTRKERLAGGWVERDGLERQLVPPKVLLDYDVGTAGKYLYSRREEAFVVCYVDSKAPPPPAGLAGS